MVVRSPDLMTAASLMEVCVCVHRDVCRFCLVSLNVTVIAGGAQGRDAVFDHKDADHSR